MYRIFISLENKYPLGEQRFEKLPACDCLRMLA